MNKFLFLCGMTLITAITNNYAMHNQETALMVHSNSSHGALPTFSSVDWWNDYYSKNSASAGYKVGYDLSKNTNQELKEKGIACLKKISKTFAPASIALADHYKSCAQKELADNYYNIAINLGDSNAQCLKVINNLTNPIADKKELHNLMLAAARPRPYKTFTKNGPCNINLCNLPALYYVMWYEQASGRTENAQYYYQLINQLNPQCYSSFTFNENSGLLYTLAQEVAQKEYELNSIKSISIEKAIDTPKDVSYASVSSGEKQIEQKDENPILESLVMNDEKIENHKDVNFNAKKQDNFEKLVQDAVNEVENAEKDTQQKLIEGFIESFILCQNEKLQNAVYESLINVFIGNSVVKKKEIRKPIKKLIDESTKNETVRCLLLKIHGFAYEQKETFEFNGCKTQEEHLKKFQELEISLDRAKLNYGLKNLLSKFYVDLGYSFKEQRIVDKSLQCFHRALDYNSHNWKAVKALIETTGFSFLKNLKRKPEIAKNKITTTVLQILEKAQKQQCVGACNELAITLRGAGFWLAGTDCKILCPVEKNEQKAFDLFHEALTFNHCTIKEKNKIIKELLSWYATENSSLAQRINIDHLCSLLKKEEMKPETFFSCALAHFKKKNYEKALMYAADESVANDSHIILLQAKSHLEGLGVAQSPELARIFIEKFLFSKCKIDIFSKAFEFLDIEQSLKKSKNLSEYDALLYTIYTFLKSRSQQSPDLSADILDEYTKNYKECGKLVEDIKGKYSTDIYRKALVLKSMFIPIVTFGNNLHYFNEFVTNVAEILALNPSKEEWECVNIFFKGALKVFHVKSSNKDWQAIVRKVAAINTICKKENRVVLGIPTSVFTET